MNDHANIDSFDRRIISILQAEGRISNVELAERIGLSPSPCLRRVRLLEERGIIVGYGAHINREAVGLGLTVFVEVSVARHSRENASHLQERLERLPGCVACHMVSGEADFLVEIVVADLAAYEAILTSHLLNMTEVATVRSNFSLRPIRTNGSLRLPD